VKLKERFHPDEPSEIKGRFHRSGSETGLETTTAGIQHSELHPPAACEVQSAETRVQKS